MTEEINGIECIAPQPGPQTEALKSSADVVVMGGANGGGKSYWLLLEAARHIDVPGYRGVIFRRNQKDFTDPGGLWDNSTAVYSPIGGWPRTSELEWMFDPDAKVSFRGLQTFNDAVSWDGKELAFIGFDEGQLFLENQFWYLFSRKRSTCGVNPSVRMTCNPVHEDDPTGGWLKRLIGWWLDWKTGYPIPERSGVIRWVCRINNELFWAGSREELVEMYGDPDLPPYHEDQTVQPISVTFIPSKLKDNPALTKKSPKYRADLMMLPEHLRKQKLDGNWNAKLSAGTFFKIGVMAKDGMIVDSLPVGLKMCRAWDLAHTENDGDWTVGVKMGHDGKGTFYIIDVIRGQWEAFHRDDTIKVAAVIDDDGQDRVTIRIPEDPAAGKSEAARMIKMLRGHIVKALPVTKKKDIRAAGFASQFNAGNVKLLKAPWNSGFLQRLDSFPTKGIPDDEIDSAADAFNELAKPTVSAFVGNSGPQEDPDAKPNKYAAIVGNEISDLWERLLSSDPMCPRWKGSYAAFRDDIGPKPSADHVLRLRDENEIYSPENCFWGLPGDPIPPKKRSIALVSR